MSFRRSAFLVGTAALAIGGATVGHPQAAGPSATAHDDRCTSLAAAMMDRWPEAGTRILSAVTHPAGPAPTGQTSPGMTVPSVDLPPHCEVIGTMHERTGVDGQDYAIRFHLRLPQDWNGRLLFQGGGGTNGELGDAIGRTTPTGAPALAQGYAVLSQDSGHDNAINSDPAKGGPTAFGFDPQARADYGGASLRPVTLAAKALIRRFYGSTPTHSYFVGCSKGGQEGMALAQRDPDLFDGIVAAAPGFALPRAALNEAWVTQRLADVVKSDGTPVTLATLRTAFSDDDLRLVREAVLGACDAADGLKDGIVGAYGQCTSAKVLPQLTGRACKSAKQAGCLSTAQIGALRAIHEGPRDAAGKPVYAPFLWDAGWNGMGWRIWSLGAADGTVPPLNVAMGAPSLAAIFTTPPRALGPSLQAYLDYDMAVRFDRDTAAIDATGSGFPRSAWQDISARSSDLDAFRRRGGKLIVPHGVSDPVFSVADTIAWYQEVDRDHHGNAAGFARVFPVPGMAHCNGGPATDGIDAFAAVVAWAEDGVAPDSLKGTAGPMSPWPNRTRPICRYPLIARPKPGVADTEKADSFTCTT